MNTLRLRLVKVLIYILAVSLLMGLVSVPGTALAQTSDDDPFAKHLPEDGVRSSISVVASSVTSQASTSFVQDPSSSPRMEASTIGDNSPQTMKHHYVPQLTVARAPVLQGLTQVMCGHGLAGFLLLIVKLLKFINK